MIVRVDTPIIGTEKVIRGRAERLTEREPLCGDDAVMEGMTRIDSGTGSRFGSGVGLGAGVGVALGSGVGVAAADAPGVGVGVGVPTGAGPAMRSTAAPTWRRPKPDAGLRPPASSGRAVWVRPAKTSSGREAGPKGPEQGDGAGHVRRGHRGAGSVAVPAARERRGDSLARRDKRQRIGAGREGADRGPVVGGRTDADDVVEVAGVLVHDDAVVAGRGDHDRAGGIRPVEGVLDVRGGIRAQRPAQAHRDDPGAVRDRPVDPVDHAAPKSPSPSAPSTLIGMIETDGAIPTMPVPLSPAAAIVPDTCVP